MTLALDSPALWGPGITPRAWQAEAHPIMIDALRDPDRAPLLVACTGAGKSVYVRSILVRVLAARRPGVVVLDVPTEALVRQMVAVLGGHPSLAGRVGVYYGRQKRIVHEGVVVCCRDSLPRLAGVLGVHGIPVRLYIADEAHLSPARQAEFVAAVSPTRIMGVTATAYRSTDREALDLWTDVAYRYPMARALQEGVLVPPRPIGWTVRSVAEIDDVFGDMIAAHVKHGPTLCNAMDQNDAEEYAGRLCDEWDVPAEPIHSGQSMSHRERLLDRLVNPSDPLICLVHVNTLTEGVDLPELRVLALRRQSIVSKGRPEHGGSRVRLVQEVGRGLRCAEGKSECLVLDPLGIMRAMGLDHQAALAAVADGEEDSGTGGSDRDDRSMAQRRRDERESIMVYPRDALADWVGQCEAVARVAGLVPGGEPWGRRSDPPTPNQMRNLARYGDAPPDSLWRRPQGQRRRPIRVGKPHSRLLRIIADRVLAGDGDRGLASDLLSLCFAAGKAYGAFKAKNGRWPKGREHFPVTLPDPPDAIDCADDTPTTETS